MTADETRAEAIFAHMRRMPRHAKYTSKIVGLFLGCNQSMAWKALEVLVQQGRVTKTRKSSKHAFEYQRIVKPDAMTPVVEEQSPPADTLDERREQLMQFPDNSFEYSVLMNALKDLDATAQRTADAPLRVLIPAHAMALQKHITYLQDQLIELKQKEKHAARGTGRIFRPTDFLFIGCSRDHAIIVVKSADTVREGDALVDNSGTGILIHRFEKCVVALSHPQGNVQTWIITLEGEKR